MSMEKQLCPTKPQSATKSRIASCPMLSEKTTKLPSFWKHRGKRKEGAKMSKILVVDDDQGVRMLYADELADEGYEVVTCGDGSRLMEFINKERPDLVVMDIRLGKYDGLDLLQDIRNAYDKLPVIICTAYPSFRQDLKSVAADDYVLKSSDLRELKLKIGMAVEGRKKLALFGGHSNMEEMKRTPIEQIDLAWKDAH